MNKRRDVLKAGREGKIYNPAGDSIREMKELGRVCGERDEITPYSTTTRLCMPVLSIFCC